VLIDESTGDSGQVASSQPSSGDHSGYTESARLENQPRLTDLIPQQLRTWLLLVLLAATAIYGLQQASSRLLTGSEEVVNRFGLNGPGTLAAWYSSGLLLVTAGGCLMVYLVRRHKVDDYRGHYRLWLWVSAWCLVASLETATEIHRSLQAAVMGLADCCFTGRTCAGSTDFDRGAEELLDELFLAACRRGLFGGHATGF
jgi:hypothetical protein